MSSVNVSDAPAEEAVVIEGTVKWFDPIKGYGFIVPDVGDVDVLVHHSTLRQGGHEVLYPMARIKCTVVERAQGLQTDRILAVDNTGAQVPNGSPKPTTILSKISDVTDDYQQAHVKWFNRMRGFGFVNTMPDGADIFVHMEVLRKADIDVLVPGQYVMVKYGNGPKGLMATDVKRIDSANVLQQPEANEMYLHEGDDVEPPTPIFAKPDESDAVDEDAE